MIDIYPQNKVGSKYKFAYPNARTAWREVLTKYKEKKVLIPSYVGYSDKEGSGVFDPITSLKVPYGIYKLDDRLNIQIDDIVGRLNRENYGAILVIHYFGFVDPSFDLLRDICRERQIDLIEDCAHYFDINSSFWEDRQRGDYLFYSLHKSLPVDHGGILWNHKDDNSLIVKQQLEHAFDLENMFAVDEIIRIRRSNFNIYKKELNRIEQVKSMRALEDYDVPNTYPILVDKGERESLYFYLVEKGIRVAALYYQLIEPLRKGEYRDMLTISSSILNLPLHQDVAQADVEMIVGHIQNFYESKG